MKLLILFIPYLFFLQTDWTNYSNEEGRFQIDTPGKFTEKIDSVNTDIGKIAYHTFFYKIENELQNEIYMLSYCDYNLDFIFSDSTLIVEDFFQTTIEAAAETVNGETLYQTDIIINEFPGKLWRIDFNEGNATAKTKAYMVGNRYYAVQVISFENKNLNKSIDRFFDSFKVTN